MPWFKLDDAFHSHPKVLALRTGAHEDAAIALWAKAGSWCAEHLTDGAIPTYAVESLLRKNATKAADELVRVRLWERTEDGYAFRSWGEYQPSRESVVTKRQKTAAKVASWRDRNQVTEQSRNPVTSSDVTTSVTLPPTRPDPTRPEESAAHSHASTRTRLVKGFQKRWDAARKAAWPGTKGDPEWDAAAKFIEKTAEIRGVSVESLATEALDSWFADEWVIANKYPDTNFPKHIAKHIDRATQPGARPTTGAEAAANAECASIRAELEALEGVPGSADRRGQLETALDAARDRLRIARGAQ